MAGGPAVIEAILSAVPGLLPVFAVLAVLLCAAAVRPARRRGLPVAAVLLWCLALAGELAATLTPDAGGASSSPSCSIGEGVWSTAVTTQGLMNVALYVPLTLFAVLAFRRPATVLGGAVLLSAATEVVQTLAGTGRACDAADFVDNCLGALAGTALGLLWRWLRQREGRAFTVRDAAQGVGTAGVGLAAVALTVRLFVPLHHDAAGFGADQETGEAEVAQRVAAELFGPGTLLRMTRITADPARSAQPYLDADTDRGTFRLEWPTARLLTAVRTDTAAAQDPANAAQGALGDEQLRRAGEQFAATWFTDTVTGARAGLAPAGTAGGARVLGYRRTDQDGVVMPMRLDITLAPDGRVLAVTADRTPDPRLPHPTVAADAATARALRAHPGGRATAAALRAERIGGQWRPCWAVDVAGPDAPTVELVDAVSGERVDPGTVDGGS